MTARPVRKLNFVICCYVLWVSVAWMWHSISSILFIADCATAITTDSNASAETEELTEQQSATTSSSSRASDGTAILHDAEHHTSDNICQVVLDQFDSYAPHEVNKLRRKLYHKCPELTTKFIDFARRRQFQPIYYHHIPKAAGSYMCALAKANFGKRAFKTHNCNLPELGPRWCGVIPQKMTCDQVVQTVNSSDTYFFGNERFLDYNNADGSFFCDSFRYVISIRETVSRVKSHFNHIRARNMNRNSLALNNYLTWALVTSKMEPVSSYPEETKGNWPVIPESTWLKEAEEVLWGYDYIISTEQDDCRDSVLTLLGFNSTRLERKNVANSSKYIEYDEGEIIEHNMMDMYLFQLAQSLMRADCDFARDFARINDGK